MTQSVIVSVGNCILIAISMDFKANTENKDVSSIPGLWSRSQSQSRGVAAIYSGVGAEFCFLILGRVGVNF